MLTGNNLQFKLTIPEVWPKGCTALNAEESVDIPTVFLVTGVVPYRPFSIQMPTLYPPYFFGLNN